MSTLGEIIAGEIVVVTTAGFATAGWVVRRISRKADERQARVDEKLTKHDDALALVLSQVTPPGAPSLTETLHSMQLQLAVINERQGHAPADNNTSTGTGIGPST